MGARGKRSREEASIDQFIAARPKKLKLVKGAAPPHLNAEGARFYQRMTAEYRIEGAADVVLLVRACECIDTITAARASMAKTGPIIRNQYGIEKLHPAVAVAKTARDGLYTALRMLEINAREVGTREDPPWVD